MSRLNYDNNNRNNNHNNNDSGTMSSRLAMAAVHPIYYINYLEQHQPTNDRPRCTKCNSPPSYQWPVYVLDVAFAL